MASTELIVKAPSLGAVTTALVLMAGTMTTNANVVYNF
jgi:hypothetical protein